ncbi:MAG: ADP-ribosylglycohydrolase family protein [Bacillota bacterium]
MLNSMLCEKALGCLTGIALGDAMGMPLEFMTREEIQNRYGYVDSLLNPSHSHIHSSLVMGQITDDTEQTLYLAASIIKHKAVTPELSAAALLKWAKEKDAFNKSYLGPSTKKALEKLMKGEDPHKTGGFSNTVGAAMKIAPVGLINPGDIDNAVLETVSASIPTHGSSTAIAAAAAVAASISTAALEQADIQQVFEAGLQGAILGAKYGNSYPGASVAKRMELARKIVQDSSGFDEAVINLCDYIGVDMLSTELVPTAFGIMMAAKGDPMKSILAAVNAGGDTDTLAAIIGGVTGTMSGPKVFPKELVAKILDVNRLYLKETALGLANLGCERFKKRSAPNS